MHACHGSVYGSHLLDGYLAPKLFMLLSTLHQFPIPCLFTVLLPSAPIKSMVQLVVLKRSGLG